MVIVAPTVDWAVVGAADGSVGEAWMDGQVQQFVERLRSRGIRVPCPDTLEVGPEVDPERFEPGPTVLHAGTRLFGARTLVLAGAQLGARGPVTLDNACVGRGCRLTGGAFSQTVCLEGVEVGTAAELREGTLLEEHVRLGHGVGLKQTVLLPWVTLGSLINFCDCLMAGGTSAEDHSEVGSGFIHFNFTPFGQRGDKATPSLFGDVVHGVLLDRPRIFVGGSGGAVGPLQVGYGSLLPAGSVLRHDLAAGMCAGNEPRPRAERPFDPWQIRSPWRKIRANLGYLGELAALRQWYRHVRAAHAADDIWLARLYREALKNIEAGLNERQKRLIQFVENVAVSQTRLSDCGGAAVQDDALTAWLAARSEWLARLHASLQDEGDEWARVAVLAAFAQDSGAGAFVNRVQSLSPAARAAVVDWLGSIRRRLLATLATEGAIAQ